MVYTVASPMVQERVGQIRDAIGNAVESATESLNIGSGDGWGLSLDTGGFIDGLINSAGVDSQEIANAFQQAVSMGGGTATSAEQFSDAGQGQAYLAWRSTIANPVDRVLAGSGVDASVLQGVAGGSSSASDVLASLDDATLDSIAANASAYSRSVNQLAMPSNMPPDAQAQMNAARSAALNFSAQVQTLVSGVRSLKGGNVFALGDLTDSAGAASSSLSQLDAALLNAEAVLGVSS